MLIAFFKAIIIPFKNSRTARILLIILLIKFAIFYGFLKTFLYPKYIKKKWDSKDERIDSVTKDILKQQNNLYYVRYL